MTLNEKGKGTLYWPPLSKGSLVTNGYQTFLGWQVLHAFPGWRCHNVVHSASPGVKVHQPWRIPLTLSAPLVHLVGHSLSKCTQVWQCFLGTGECMFCTGPLWSTEDLTHFWSIFTLTFTTLCKHSFSAHLLRQVSPQVFSEQSILQKRILQSRPLLEESSYPGSREWQLAFCLPHLLFIGSWPWFSYMSWSDAEQRSRDTTPCPWAASRQRTGQQGRTHRHGSASDTHNEEENW